MLLLGAVQLFEPVNGYQIRRELVSWRVDEWAHINPGSIYSGLETLARAGHLARHSLVEGNRTVTVYTTTEEGRAEFQRLFAEAVRTHDRGSARGFTTALSLAPLVDREVFLGLLEERLRGGRRRARRGRGPGRGAGRRAAAAPAAAHRAVAGPGRDRARLAGRHHRRHRGRQRVRTPATRPTGCRRRTTRAGPCRPTASATARPSASPTDRRAPSGARAHESAVLIVAAAGRPTSSTQTRVAAASVDLTI